MAVNPVALGVAALGGVFTYAGIKGYSVPDAIQTIVTGKSPATLSNKYPIGDPADPNTPVSTGPESAVGAVQLDGVPVAAWIAEVLLAARAHGWTGKATSGYRSAQDQTEACATGAQPCAPPGTSHHQGIVWRDGAVDVTNAAQLSAILSSGKVDGRGLVWAGDKDPVHFSVPGVWREGEASY